MTAMTAISVPAFFSYDVCNSGTPLFGAVGP